MSVSSSDVQAKLDAVKIALSKTTNSYPAMVRKYGPDWTSWPAGSEWGIVRDNLVGARIEVGQLVAPTTLTAKFSYKES